MPVTPTVLDNIATELITRLETLINGAEQTDVVEVVQPLRLADYTPQDLQIVVMQGESVRVPELDCPGNPPAEARRQTFNIHCHVRPSESDTEPADTKINRFHADVRKVVCTPTSTWHTFDDNAIDAQWLDPQPMDSGEGTDGITLPLAITYRTDEGNPYNVRA